MTDTDCLIEEYNFYGIDCIDKFCEKFLLKSYEFKKTKKSKKEKSETNASATPYKTTTIMLHIMKSYDGRFMLEWCQKLSFIPDNIMRSCSKIQYMYFKSGNVRFIDT